MGERIGLSDAEWEIVGALLPAERGRGCRPAQDNRRYFESMMWIARTGGAVAAAAGRIWQVEQRVPPLPALDDDRRVRRVLSNQRGRTTRARVSPGMTSKSEVKEEQIRELAERVS